MYSSSSGRQSAAAAAVAAPSGDEPAEGRLIEFQKDSKSGLALLLKKDGKRNWSAVDTRYAQLGQVQSRLCAFPQQQTSEADFAVYLSETSHDPQGDCVLLAAATSGIRAPWRGIHAAGSGDDLHCSAGCVQ